MAQFDLTRINCQYLDRHLTFPLLEFLCGKEVRKLTAAALCHRHHHLNMGELINNVLFVCIFTDLQSTRAPGVHSRDGEQDEHD